MKNVLLGIGWLLVILLAAICFSQCNKANRTSNLYNSALDTLYQYRNELNQQVTERNVLVSTINELQSINSAKDSSIKQLQSIVNKRTETAIVVGNTTSGSIDMEPDITYVEQDSCEPVYSSTYTDEWLHADVIASSNLISLDYVVKNKYDISTEWKRKWFLGTPTLSAKIVNLNPNTETNDFIVFQKKAPHKRGLLIGGIGLSLGFLGAVILLR